MIAKELKFLDIRSFTDGDYCKTWKFWTGIQRYFSSPKNELRLEFYYFQKQKKVEN